ncbi:MAG: SUMF1/EgtB/PvdO family nonheme iron enzyme, partial [Cyanobacteria bacterium J06649_11]
ANVLLKRRLNNLVRIDHQTEIDRDFITFDEYQLFIDEMRQQGKNLQPDHWKTEKFPDGDARKPITGVRSTDAEEFCEWLTKKESLPEFSYRLPTIRETKEITAVDPDIGCWCKNNDALKISGITVKQWQNWQQELSAYFVVQNKNITLDFDLYLYLDLDLYLDLELYRNLDRYFDLELYRYLDRNLDFYRNLDLDLYRYLDLDLYRYLDLKIKTNTASNFSLLYFPLIPLILFYESISKIYAEASQNKKIRQNLKLSRQECEQKSQEYTKKKDNIFKLYAYLVLMEQRQEGKMPAWEGIRIVRERKETN